MSRGYWKLGTSGNPGGRPVNPVTAQFRAAAAEFAPIANQKLFEAIKAGDMNALRIYYDRMVPALRPVDAPVEISDKRGKHSMQDRIEGIADLMLSGELPASVAASLLDVLTSRAKLTELADLQQQVAELKAAQPQQPKR